jgi:hypothetical protein
MWPRAYCYICCAALAVLLCCSMGVDGVPSSQLTTSNSRERRALHEAFAGNSGGNGPPGLGWCGSANDFTEDQKQMTQALLFIGGVCCDMMHESCTAQSPRKPQSCATPACARAVGLTTTACKDYLTQNSFASSAYSPLLSPSTAVCASTEQTQDSPVVVATGPVPKQGPVTSAPVVLHSGRHGLLRAKREGVGRRSVHGSGGSRHTFSSRGPLDWVRIRQHSDIRQCGLRCRPI